MDGINMRRMIQNKTRYGEEKTIEYFFYQFQRKKNFLALQNTSQFIEYGCFYGCIMHKT